MKQTLHIIARNLTKDETESIDGMRDSQVYWHFNTHKAGLSNKEYITQLKPEEKKRINYRVMSQILQFSNETISNKSISDLLEHERMNLWFYQRLTVYMAARNMEYLLEECRVALKNHAVTLYTDIPSNFLSHFLPQEVECRYSRKTTSNKKNGYSIGLSMILASMKVLFRAPGRIGGRHLIIDNARPQKIHSTNTQGSIKGNFVLNNLFEKIDDRFCLIMEAGLPGKRTAGISEFEDSVQYKNAEIKYVSSDLIMLRAVSKHSSRKKINSILRKLKDDLRMINDKFSGTEYSLIAYLLSGQGSSYRVYISRYIGFRDLCGKYKPLSITAADENSPYNKCLLDAAKSLGIKTIGIQHGAIHELHPAYRFTTEESQKGLAPDLTLTWGEYWRNLLIDIGNYRDSGIRITGQLRTDTISDLKSFSDNRDNDSRIILFASQPQRDPSLRRTAASDLFAAASRTKGVTIWLKPHPLEKDFRDYYQSVANEYHFNDVEYFEDRDLYELIHLSDAVYTCFSTVGTEAIYFSKPLIIHDPLDQDIQGYISAGVGIRVRDESTCVETLKELVAGTLVQDNDKVLEFIEKYAFKIDGNVSERVIKCIIGDS